MFTQGRDKHMTSRPTRLLDKGFRLSALWKWNCFCLHSALQGMNSPTIVVCNTSTVTARLSVGRGPKPLSLSCSGDRLKANWHTKLSHSVLWCGHFAALFSGPSDNCAENGLVTVLCTSLCTEDIVPARHKNESREKCLHLQIKTDA